MHKIDTLHPSHILCKTQYDLTIITGIIKITYIT